jgi:hypothetical protein
MITFLKFLENNLNRNFYHVTTEDNYNNIMKDGILPQIGQRSINVETKPQIFLFVDKSSMEDAVMNWLTDEFDEDENLVVLQVTLPQDFPIKVNGSEVTTDIPIPPKYIQKTNIKV